MNKVAGVIAGRLAARVILQVKECALAEDEALALMAHSRSMPGFHEGWVEVADVLWPEWRECYDVHPHEAESP